MQEILQIFNQSPPPHHQMPPHLQQRLVNVESQFNWSIDSDLSLPGIFDLSDHFQCSEFVESPFTNFSGSSIDELSKVTAMTEQNGSSKKRKLESDDVEVDSRKQRDEGDAGLLEPEVKTGCCINTRNENSDPQVDLKPDYIHVRARRGQATDSHSLAERARREKIKKKMQFLQDLVPGCHKITNKAAILDEIIDYVQRLQRQVQFLTMKLAASTASVDFKMENALPKEQPVQLSQWR